MELLETDSATSVEFDDQIIECCKPFAEIYHNKPFSQISEDEILEAGRILVNEASRIYPGIDLSKDIYTLDECTLLIDKINLTNEILCTCLRESFTIRNHAVAKLKVKPNGIQKICDPSFRILNFNDHFILKDVDGNQYHIKTTLINLLYLRGSILNEIFVYKVLEFLGYGPKAEAVFVPEFKTLYTLTYDLSNNLEKEKSIHFITADEQGCIQTVDEKSYIDLLTFNFVVDFLELADVYEKESNYGIKKTVVPEKSPKKISEKPFIIDFHLKKSGLSLSNLEIIKKYVYLTPKRDEFLFGMTLSQINRDSLKQIVGSLDEGISEDHQTKLQEAIENAFKYTEKIHEEIIWALKTSEVSQENTQSGNQPQRPFEMSKYSMDPVQTLKEFYLSKWKELKLKLL